MDAAEFAEYEALCSIIRAEQLTAHVILPDLRHGAASLFGAAAEQATRAFYIAIGEVYYDTAHGVSHCENGGLCDACAAGSAVCAIPESVANVSRLRAMLQRLAELGRSEALV
jgi:hypothetical protein